jgi:hypothetical protein
MEAVAKFCGKDSTFTHDVLDLLTGGAYGRLRHGSLTHDEVHELAKAGNNIGALSKRARLTRRPLDNDEITDIERNIDVIWKPNPKNPGERAEALGVEAAIKLLQRDKSVKILTYGRPDSNLGRNGPDIIAIDRATDRIIIVEAKGNLRTDKALTQDTLETTVGARKYTQPSREWLRAPRAGTNDYMALLRKPPVSKDYDEAYDLMQQIRRREGPRGYDVKIVHVHQEVPAVKVYGPGLDRATELIKSGGVGDINIVHVPYPNRRP